MNDEQEEQAATPSVDAPPGQEESRLEPLQEPLPVPLLAQTPALPTLEPRQVSEQAILVSPPPSPGTTAPFLFRQAQSTTGPTLYQPSSHTIDQPLATVTVPLASQVAELERKRPILLSSMTLRKLQVPENRQRVKTLLRDPLLDPAESGLVSNVSRASASRPPLEQLATLPGEPQPAALAIEPTRMSPVGRSSRSSTADGRARVPEFPPALTGLSLPFVLDERPPSTTSAPELDATDVPSLPGTPPESVLSAPPDAQSSDLPNSLEMLVSPDHTMTQSHLLPESPAQHIPAFLPSSPVMVTLPIVGQTGQAQSISRKVILASAPSSTSMLESPEENTRWPQTSATSQPNTRPTSTSSSADLSFSGSLEPSEPSPLVLDAAFPLPSATRHAPEVPALKPSPIFRTSDTTERPMPETSSRSRADARARQLPPRVPPVAAEELADVSLPFNALNLPSIETLRLSAENAATSSTQLFPTTSLETVHLSEVHRPSSATETKSTTPPLERVTREESTARSQQQADTTLTELLQRSGPSERSLPEHSPAPSCPFASLRTEPEQPLSINSEPHASTDWETLARQLAARLGLSLDGLDAQPSSLTPMRRRAHTAPPRRSAPSQEPDETPPKLPQWVSIQHPSRSEVSLLGPTEPTSSADTVPLAPPARVLPISESRDSSTQGQQSLFTMTNTETAPTPSTAPSALPPSSTEQSAAAPSTTERLSTKRQPGRRFVVRLPPAQGIEPEQPTTVQRIAGLIWIQNGAGGDLPLPDGDLEPSLWPLKPEPIAPLPSPDDTEAEEDGKGGLPVVALKGEDAVSVLPDDATFLTELPDAGFVSQRPRGQVSLSRQPGVTAARLTTSRVEVQPLQRIDTTKNNDELFGFQPSPSIGPEKPQSHSDPASGKPLNDAKQPLVSPTKLIPTPPTPNDMPVVTPSEEENELQEALQDTDLINDPDAVHRIRQLKKWGTLDELVAIHQHLETLAPDARRDRLEELIKLRRQNRKAPLDIDISHNASPDERRDALKELERLLRVNDMLQESDSSAESKQEVKLDRKDLAEVALELRWRLFQQERWEAEAW